MWSIMQLKNMVNALYSSRVSGTIHLGGSQLLNSTRENVKDATKVLLGVFHVYVKFM